MEIRIVPFDAAVHGRFVFSEAMNAAGKWPNLGRSKYDLADEVRRATVTVPGGSVVAVAPDDPDMFVGFVVCNGPQSLVYAYTKYACRRMGVATKLAAAVGICLSLPTSLAIWTPAASRIAAAGYRLYPAIQNER